MVQLTEKRRPLDRVYATLPDGPKRYIAAKPLARFLPDLTKKVFQKHGFSSAALIADWSDVVGLPLAEQCIPERLKWPRGRRPVTEDATETPTGATLILRTDAAHALEIEYASAQILERINAYFGYRAITTLKIVQGPLMTKPARSSPKSGRPAATQSPVEAQACDQAISEIEDADLKAALERMRRSVFRAP